MTKWLMTSGSLLAMAMATAACGGGSAPTGSNPGSCKINGSWSLTIDSEPAVANLAGGGTYGLSVNGAAPTTGTWSLDDKATFSITDAQCGAATGKYAANISQTCMSFTLEVQSDACEGRRNSLDGATLTKR